MGSSVSVLEISNKSSDKNLIHSDDFQLTMKKAIVRSSLEDMESLLRKKRYVDHTDESPLHLAAQYGILDCVELLISAGYYCSKRKKDGYTPLHCCAFNQTGDALAIATLLCIMYPTMIDAYDLNKSTPLHLAILRYNLEVVQALILQKADIYKLNGDGRDAIDLAKSLETSQIINFIMSTMDRKLNATEKIIQPSKERILEIWETFFENAFRHIHGQSFMGLHDDMQSDEYDTLNIACTNSIVRGTSAVFLDFDYDDRNYLPLIDEVGTSNDMDPCVAYWLNWILCYDSSCNDDTPLSYRYYVVDITGVESSRWLYEHLEIMQRVDLLERHSDDDMYIQEATAIYSLSLYEAYVQGWMCYFDDINNLTSWMHVPTGTCQHYLYLNDYEDDHPNLLRYDCNSPLLGSWVGCLQTCSKSWLTVIDDDYSMNNYVDDEYLTYDHDVYDGYNGYNSKYEIFDDDKKSLWYDGIRNIADEKSQAYDDDKYEKAYYSKEDLQESHDYDSYNIYYYNYVTGHSSYVKPDFNGYVDEMDSKWSLFCTASSSWQWYW
jgi:hypothetical protein